MIYALWHGGCNYAAGELERPGERTTDVEVFDTLADVGYALSDRYHLGDWTRQSFNYADGTSESVLTPMVDHTSEFLVWFSDPREARDPYPDRRVYFGPRLGVRRETC